METGMKKQAIHKLLDLAKRLPSIEILDGAEITPLLEAVRAIKAAEGELEAACDVVDLQDAEFDCLGGLTPLSELGELAELAELDQTPRSALRTFSLSF